MWCPAASQVHESSRKGDRYRQWRHQPRDPCGRYRQPLGQHSQFKRLLGVSFTSEATGNFCCCVSYTAISQVKTQVEFSGTRLSLHQRNQSSKCRPLPRLKQPESHFELTGSLKQVPDLFGQVFRWSAPHSQFSCWIVGRPVPAALCRKNTRVTVVCSDFILWINGCL
jgi:hypothetical protein